MLFACPKFRLDGTKTRANGYHFASERVEVVEVAVKDVYFRVGTNARCVDGAVEFVLTRCRSLGHSAWFRVSKFSSSMRTEMRLEERTSLRISRVMRYD